MTEGKGYCARKRERQGIRELSKFIERKDEIVVVPGTDDEKKGA